jgi:hypothetical protein
LKIGRLHASSSATRKELKHRNKLEDRSTPRVYIGYEEGVKVYRVLDLVIQCVRTTRYIVFDEDHGWS